MRLIGLILLLIPLGGVSQFFHMDIVSYQPGSLGEVYDCKGEMYVNPENRHAYIQIDSLYYNEFEITRAFLGQEDDTIYVMKGVVEPADTMTYHLIARDRERVFFWNVSNKEEPIILFRQEGDRHPYHRD